MTEIKKELLEGVKLTQKAAHRLQQIQTEEEGEFLRASVTGGGCSGLNYNLSWDKNIEKSDEVYKSQGIHIVVDNKSLLYLKGMEIDFSNDLLSGGFRFNNPNASRTCGCGTSFSV